MVGISGNFIDPRAKGTGTGKKNRKNDRAPFYLANIHTAGGFTCVFVSMYFSTQGGSYRYLEEVKWKVSTVQEKSVFHFIVYVSLVESTAISIGFVFCAKGYGE